MKYKISYTSRLLFLFIFSVVVTSFLGCDAWSRPDRTEKSSGRVRADDAEKIRQAFENRRSHLFVQSSGVVTRILRDDVKPPRHQRFILRLDHGQTLLITHNIDLAPRIERLKVGDHVYFSGEYIYNEKGGVVHWTHHDPHGNRVGGGIEHKGKRYY